MTAMRKRTKSGRKPGCGIPWMIAAFFGVVVLANAAMVYIAVASFTGLEVEGPYRRGLDYNRVLEAQRAQQALGWTVTVTFEPTGARRGRIVADARDAAGGPLVGAAVVAHLIRPTQEGYDIDVPLAVGRDGAHAAEVELPLPGLWEIQTQIVHTSGVYRAAKRIVAP